MSLRDSGTKSKKFLRVIAVFAVVAVLFVSTGLVAFAEGSGTETTEQGEATEFKSGYPALPDDATMGERLMYGLQVAGIGMTVVFLVLIIIMAILYVFKLVATSGAKKPAKAPAAAPVASAPAAASASDDEATVVAIATAAIAASRGASECAFKVISVTKIQ